jgi:hypothetical protein
VEDHTATNWSVSIEPSEGGWRWEVAHRRPDAGPDLDSWKVIREGTAPTRSEAHAQAIEALLEVQW